MINHNNFILRGPVTRNGRRDNFARKIMIKDFIFRIIYFEWLRSLNAYTDFVLINKRGYRCFPQEKLR